MKLPRSQLPSVALRVAGAIQLLKSENPGGRITVMAVCRLAEISRANLYENHPDIIRVIQEQSPTRTATRTTKPTDTAVLVAEIKILKKQLKALMLLCIEQRIAIESLHKDLEYSPRTVKRRDMPKSSSEAVCCSRARSAKRT